MKLKDFINSGEIDFSEQIFLNKFETLFSNLSNNDNIIYYTANHHKTTNDLIKIFEKVSYHNNNTKLLMINPDIDFPFIKQSIINTIENVSYNNDTQSFWEKQNIDYFLDDKIISLIPKNLEIFCNSNLIEHKNVTMIPLGRDFKGMNFVKNFSNKKITKDILCYLNFSTPPFFWHWYGRIRQYISDFADKNDWILKENTIPNNNREINNNFLNYYNKLSRSKFMIAPRGCGLDTYRLWDSIYLGCIPIVVNYSNNTGYNQFKDLPIYFIDSWEDYLNLTPEKLNQVWDTMINTEYNYEKLKFSYWENLIKK